MNVIYDIQHNYINK